MYSVGTIVLSENLLLFFFCVGNTVGESWRMQLLRRSVQKLNTYLVSLMFVYNFSHTFNYGRLLSSSSLVKLTSFDL
jgi:hypothetical protein